MWGMRESLTANGKDLSLRSKMTCTRDGSLHIGFQTATRIHPAPLARPFSKGLLSGKEFRKPNPHFHFSIGANLRPFGAPPSMGRRENAASQTPHGEGLRYKNAASTQTKKYRQVSLTVSDLYPHHVVKAGF